MSLERVMSIAEELAALGDALPDPASPDAAALEAINVMMAHRESLLWQLNAEAPSAALADAKPADRARLTDLLRRAEQATAAFAQAVGAERDRAHRGMLELVGASARSRPAARPEARFTERVA